MRQAFVFFAAATVVVGGCGYRPLYANGPVPESERLAVVVTQSSVTPQSAADEVAAGVREALTEGGALRGGEGYPRAEIEVVRIDEESDAIADVPGAGGAAAGADETHAPRAHGLRVGVVARAQVRKSAFDAPTTDTGDVRAFTVIAAESQPGAAADAAFERAARAAGRLAGAKLGARLLGHPAASE